MFSQLYAIIFTSFVVIDVAVRPSDVMIDTDESIDNREVGTIFTIVRVFKGGNFKVGKRRVQQPWGGRLNAEHEQYT